MPRVRQMRNCHAVSDPAMEEAPYETVSLPMLERLGLGSARPSDTAILKLPHPLRADELTARALASFGSTEGQQRRRDREACRTRSGNRWHVGMKMHIVVDTASALVPRGATTQAIGLDLTHPIEVIRHQFGLIESEFRELRENAMHVITLAALQCLCVVRRHLRQDFVYRGEIERFHGG
jgi:hypothetical protein